MRPAMTAETLGVVLFFVYWLVVAAVILGGAKH